MNVIINVLIHLKKKIVLPKHPPCFRKSCDYLNIHEIYFESHPVIIMYTIFHQNVDIHFCKLIQTDIHWHDFYIYIDDNQILPFHVFPIHIFWAIDYIQQFDNVKSMFSLEIWFKFFFLNMVVIFTKWTWKCILSFFFCHFDYFLNTC